MVGWNNLGRSLQLTRFDHIWLGIKANIFCVNLPCLTIGLCSFDITWCFFLVKVSLSSSLSLSLFLSKIHSSCSKWETVFVPRSHFSRRRIFFAFWSCPILRVLSASIRAQLIECQRDPGGSEGKFPPTQNSTMTRREKMTGPPPPPPSYSEFVALTFWPPQTGVGVAMVLVFVFEGSESEGLVTTTILFPFFSSITVSIAVSQYVWAVAASPFGLWLGETGVMAWSGPASAELGRSSADDFRGPSMKELGSALMKLPRRESFGFEEWMSGFKKWQPRDNRRLTIWQLLFRRL